MNHGFNALTLSITPRVQIPTDFSKSALFDVKAVPRPGFGHGKPGAKASLMSPLDSRFKSGRPTPANACPASRFLENGGSFKERIQRLKTKPPP